MIYEIETQVPAKVKKEEVYVAPCVKCGSDDIRIREYEDQFGCISTATCGNCKNEVQENRSKIGIIKEWNNRNDIPILIESKSAKIIELKEEIKQLKEKLKKAPKPKRSVATQAK
jgi:hypothetical protein